MTRTVDILSRARDIVRCIFQVNLTLFLFYIESSWNYSYNS